MKKNIKIIYKVIPICFMIYSFVCIMYGNFIAHNSYSFTMIGHLMICLFGTFVPFIVSFSKELIKNRVKYLISSFIYLLLGFFLLYIYRTETLLSLIYLIMELIPAMIGLLIYFMERKNESK